MPIGKKLTRYRRKSTRRSRVPRSVAYGMNSAMADQISAKLKYNTYLDLSGGASSIQQYVFRLNSIFDPDLTGVGHQPLGRDEYAAFYNKYEVTGVSVAVDWVISTTVGSNLCCTLVPTHTSTLLTNDESIPERSHATSIVIGTPAAGAIQHQRRFFNIKKLSGNNDPGNLQSAMGSNPADQWYLQLNAQSLDGVSAPDLYAKVTLVYYVRFFDRAQLVQS